MSQRSKKYNHVKSRLHLSKPVFHLQDKKADDQILTTVLIKSAKRSGQLVLSNRGLGTVPENVWKLDEIVLEEAKDVDFNRSDSEKWWNSESLKTLDLSSNSITVIPPEVKHLEDLVTLYLHDNALVGLPSELGSLRRLATLTADRNRLVELPSGFYKLTELRMLSLSHNLLTTLKPDFGDLVMLNHLNLSHNKLTCLPPGLGYLVRLRECDLSHNQLCELPPDIANMRELRKLDISHNMLLELPPLGELRRLCVLSASHNRLAAPPDLAGAAALVELRLAHNALTELSEEFVECVCHLRTLDLQSNKLTKLPDNVGLLQNLARLDLADNDLRSLPSTLGLLSQLQALRVSGNALPSLGESVKRAGGAALVRALRRRMVDDAADHQLPEQLPDMYAMRKSQSLCVAGRGLEAVGGEVLQAAAAAAVASVDLARNKLTHLPPQFSLLSEFVTVLVLSHNRFSELPEVVTSLRRLQALEATDNRIHTLPDSLANLTELRELALEHNQLCEIPAVVYSLSRLEILSLSGNKIRELRCGVAGGGGGGGGAGEEGLARLRRLAVLRLDNNEIVAVPPELGLLTQLRTVELCGNVFRVPRQAVLARGAAHTLAYLRDRLPPAAPPAPPPGNNATHN